MLFPVNQDTTAADLLTAAANRFAEPVDVRASVLLEHFGTVGVQRPLRRYEHVRDVMNSWDDDRANTLILVPARAADANPSGLSAANVPRNKPAEASFLMYHSQKPGHWDKRLVTIHPDGQIVMTKGAKDKESTNICHLSDFDIYTPTAKQISKKIKPPKKYCYAIKSQQKSTFFESAATYVHFLCASDKTHGTSFYDAVQGWRSWYLVHVMGEGRKKTESTGIHRSPSRASKPVLHAQHNTNNSSVDSHYQLGSFKPMAFDTAFERPSSSSSQSAYLQQQPMNQIPSRKLSTRDRTHPPSAFPKHMLPSQPQLADDEPLVNLASNMRPSLEARDSDEAFATSGLLGRSYSTRRREQQDRDVADKNGWVTGGLINATGDSAMLGRQISIKRSPSKRMTGATTTLTHRPSTRDGGHANASGIRRHDSPDLTHSASVRRGPPKPLIDLTPKYVPPPQHMKKGKGYKPRPEELGQGTGGLVDAATSGDPTWRDAIPESKDWRGRAGAAQHMGGIGMERGGGGSGSGYGSSEGMNTNRTRSRSRSLRRDPQALQSGRARYASPTGVDEQAFTGAGLVGRSHGSLRVRRDVSGSSGGAQGPLLDISDPSSFAKGSLLAKVEREQPTRVPVFDRES